MNRIRLAVLGTFVFLVFVGFQQGVFANGPSDYGCSSGTKGPGMGWVSCSGDGPYNCSLMAEEEHDPCPTLCNFELGYTGILVLSSCSEESFECACWLQS